MHQYFYRNNSYLPRISSLLLNCGRFLPRKRRAHSLLNVCSNKNLKSVAVTPKILKSLSKSSENMDHKNSLISAHQKFLLNFHVTIFYLWRFWNTARCTSGRFSFQSIYALKWFSFHISFHGSHIIICTLSAWDEGKET